MKNLALTSGFIFYVLLVSNPQENIPPLVPVLAKGRTAPEGHKLAVEFWGPGQGRIVGRVHIHLDSIYTDSKIKTTTGVFMPDAS
jgi:hypothetical protein